MKRVFAAALEMLLPFEAKSPSSKRERQSLTKEQMAELAGIYTNNRQTIELEIENRQLIRRRGEPGTGVPSGPFSWSGENRLATDSPTTSDDSPRPNASFFVVRDASGRPQYLITGSRALKRSP